MTLENTGYQEPNHKQYQCGVESHRPSATLSKALMALSLVHDLAVMLLE
jgi:hypothetical protein